MVFVTSHSPDQIKRTAQDKINPEITKLQVKIVKKMRKRVLLEATKEEDIEEILKNR